MHSFQAKIGLKKMRKGENKNYRFISFLPNAKLKIPIKQQKSLKKLKKYHYGFLSSQNSLEKAEKENIKIIVPFRSNSTRNRKFKKNSKKIQRFKTDHYGFISSQNRLEKDEKERK